MMSEEPAFLLDTSVFLWLATGSEKVPSVIAKTIEEAVQKERVFVSQISLWEIALKESIGKLRLSSSIDSWLKKATQSVQVLDLPVGVILDATRLPGEFHKDPADRFIVATARQNSLTLVTSDSLIVDYARQGYVKFLEV